MLSMSLKTLNIILMCFDGKKQPFEQNRRESTAIVITKKMLKELKIDFFWTDDEVQFLLSLANSNFGGNCGRSTFLIQSPFEGQLVHDLH